MENFEHIDQTIRKKFENFEPEPPASVWENVRSTINQTPPPPPSGLMLPILFIVTFLMFVGSMLLNLLSGNPENIEATDSETYLKTAGMISTGSTTEFGQTLQDAIYQTYQENHLSEVVSNTNPVVPQAAPANEIRVKAPMQPYTSASTSQVNTSIKSTTPEPQVPARTNWKPGLRQALDAGEITVATAVQFNLNQKDVRKLSRYQDYARNSRATWSIGAYFNPEVTNFNSGDLENTISYSIGVMPQITFSHFFVQSGLNARFTNDMGNSNISYNKFLGTYEDVYLVTFDSTENGIIPTYYTETVEVFDTIDHYSVTQTHSNYTYLEVPVMLGYSFDLGKVSFFAKAGPAVSFLVGSKMPVQSPEEGARIVNVDYQVPARSQVNWQLMLGAGIDYQLSDRMSFSLEPTYRYALKSEYNLSGNEKAGANSFGVRLGLNYHF